MKKHSIFAGRGIEDIIFLILLWIAFYFSFKFYSDMLLGLCLAGLTFEILKPSLMNEGWKQKKELRGKLYIGLASIFILLSLLATCSVLVNNYSKIVAESNDKIETKEYKDNKILEDQVRAEIKRLKNDIKKYPKLEDFQKDIPNDHSTNLSNVTNSWLAGKQKIEESLNNANKNLNNILKKYESINQYKQVANEDKYKSYTKLFQLIAEMTSANPDLIEIIVFLLIAVLLEIGIITSKHISIEARMKRLGLVKETLEKRLQRHNEQLAEANFENMLKNNNLNLKDTKKTEKKQLLDGKNTGIAKPSNNKEVPVKFKFKKYKDKKNINNKKIIDFPNDEVKKEIKTDKVAPKFEEKEINQDNVKKYFNYLLENSKNDVAIGYKKVAEALEITQGEAQRIYKFLNKNGYLKKLDTRKTKIINKDIDSIDELFENLKEKGDLNGVDTK